MKKIVVLLLFILACNVIAQNYKQVKIYLKDENSVKNMLADGMQFDHPHFTKDNAIEVFISDKEYDLLQTLGYEYEVLISDWEEHYKSRTALSEAEKADFINQSREKYGVKSFDFGSMGGYYTTEEVYAELDNMYSLYPNLITQKESIGNTLEGRPMYVVKISDNPGQDEDEPEVFFNSLIHCREAQTVMTLVYYMYYLLENYGTDPEVTYLVDNREIYFLPIFNVDGYMYNQTNSPNGGGMWRKNRRNNGNGTYGVDLNRNFGYEWGYDNSGSSNYPGDETYRGTAGFSEPATFNVKEFCESRNFVNGLNYHTYSNLLIYPWGYIDAESEDSSIYRQMARDITAYNGYSYGNSSQLLYAVNGSADDWMYGEQTTKEKMLTMTPEVGSASDGFWPAQSRIFPLAQENLRPNLYVTWVAGAFPQASTGEFSPEYSMPGDTVEFYASLYNKGLSDASAVTVNLTSLEDDIVVLTNSIEFGALASQANVTAQSPLVFTSNTSLQVGEKYYLEIETVMNETVIKKDTVFYIPGIPQFVFNDTNDDPSVLWSLQSVSGQQDWGVTTDYHTAPYAYTESPSGSYSNNAETSMKTTNPIDLSSISVASLRFYTKWDIEDRWDCGQVFASTNGTSWTPLEGLYSDEGSGSGEQPSGQPVYDDNQPEWVMEEMDLADYVGGNLYLKFEFRSDGSQVGDGWLVDDIQIYYYGEAGEMQTMSVQFNEGWNMISTPYSLTNSNVASLFPTVSTPVYSFDGTYVSENSLSMDKGYWVKFPEAGSVSYQGYEGDLHLSVNEGWNLIGVNEYLNLAAGVSSEPENIVETSFFEFNNGYHVADTLMPGKAYWVRTSQSGSLWLNGMPVKEKAPKKSFTGIVVADAAFNSTRLNFSETSGLGNSALMPPKPPKGVFDARFSDDTHTAVMDGTTKQINLSGIELPLTLTASGVSVELEYYNSNGINTIILADGESTTIAECGDMLKVNFETIPVDYAITQNYPNPFNPSTNISYSLPKQGLTVIKVYNLLGEEIATLVNEVQQAGVHKLEFNAAGLNSGVYFYQIQSGDFTASKKMVLLK